MIFWGLNWFAIQGKNIPQYCKIDMQLFCSGPYINLEKPSLWRSMTEVTAFPPKKKKKVVLRNWWERFMMSRGFRLNVKLNRKIENSCLLTNLLQSQRWLLWRHSCGHWRYPGCCGYFRCHSLFPLQPADPAPCHFLRAGGGKGCFTPSWLKFYFQVIVDGRLYFCVLTFVLFTLDYYEIWSFCHTVLIMLIVLSFCLSIFLSLFLLVIMMVFLTCYSFHNLNLNKKMKRGMTREIV